METVKLNLTHNLLSIRMPEIKFSLFSTIESIKITCMNKFGTSQDTMDLLLQDANGNDIQILNENDRTLGFYSPQDNYTIHVIDLNPNSLLKELEDFQGVQKYMISEEDYDKLPDNFRKFRAMLEKDPNINLKKKIEVGNEYMMSEAYSVPVNSRCKIIESNHRGQVVYIGRVPEVGQGYFVGVKLDEPYGKNDGSVLNQRYFQCPNNFGLFIRPNKIETGDFPELDLDDEL